MPTAAERIAEMRKTYANSELNADHLSDLELAFRELDAIKSEWLHVRNQYSTMLAEQNQWERDVRTAAKREAQDDRLAWRDVYMDGMIRQADYDLRVLIERARSITAKPSSRQVEELRQAAADAAGMLKKRPDTEELKVAVHWRDEARRLRDYIRSAARKLHAESGWTSGTCRCPGCEMTRGMDEDWRPKRETEANPNDKENN